MHFDEKKNLIEIEEIFFSTFHKMGKNSLKFSQCTFDMAIKDGFWSLKIVTYML